MSSNPTDKAVVVNSSVQLVEIATDYVGQRIDNYLITRLKGVPKSRIYRLLRKGEVRVNKGRIKPEYKLQAGDVVRIPPVRMALRPDKPLPGQKLRATLANHIIYQDDALIILNKPCGLAVHGGSGVSLGVIESLRAMYPEYSYLELVHRLDRDTSGCLMIAKKRPMLLHLQQQMMHGKIEKCYTTLVAGRWKKQVTRISAPLKKNQRQSGERMVRVSEEGKPSITHFKVLNRYQDATLITALLETGRTHQIRVHCQFAGSPLAGDEKYGDQAFNKLMKTRGLKRLFLHAHHLSFKTPAGEKKTFHSELPRELTSVLSQLEGI